MSRLFALRAAFSYQAFAARAIPASVYIASAPCLRTYAVVASRRPPRPSSTDSNFALNLNTSDDDVGAAAASAKGGLGGDSGGARRRRSGPFAAPPPSAHSTSDSETDVDVYFDNSLGTATPLHARDVVGVASSDVDGDASAVDARASAGSAEASAASAPSSASRESDPDRRRRAFQQALYTRRNVRTMLGNDSEEVDLYASALAREHANDIELTDLEDITRVDDYQRGTGDDPLERE